VALTWVYLQLCPDYTGIELGIGESLLIKAIGESTGRSLQLIKADLKKEGDLGLVAMVSKLSTVTHSNTLTFLKELQKYAKDPVQAKAAHGSFRVLKLKGDRSQCRSLGEPHDQIHNSRSNVSLSPKGKRCQLSQSSLPHVRAKRQSILSEVWKASFG
jgi:hypothetical protein